MKKGLKVGQPFSPYRVFHGIYIPDELAECEEVSSGAKLVWGYLSKCAGRDNYAYPSHVTIAQKTGQSRQSAINQIRELESQKFLRVERDEKHGSNRYYFLWHQIFRKEQGVMDDDLDETSEGSKEILLQEETVKNLDTPCQKTLQDKDTVKNLDTPCQKVGQEDVKKLDRGCKKIVPEMNQEDESLTESGREKQPTPPAPSNGIISESEWPEIEQHYQKKLERLYPKSRTDWEKEFSILREIQEEHPVSKDDYLQTLNDIFTDWKKPAEKRFWKMQDERRLSARVIKQVFVEFIPVQQVAQVPGTPAAAEANERIFESPQYPRLPDDQWQQILVHMESKISPENIDTWIKPLQVFVVDEQQFLILGPTQYHRDWINSHFKETLIQVFSETIGSQVHIQIETGRS